MTLFYNELSDTINLEFNIIAEHVDGDYTEIPPRLYPFVSMRGIPMMKYQGGSITTAQTQLSYRFNRRWNALLFGGVGRTFSNKVDTPNRSSNDAPNIFAGGIGFRIS